jgi:hypothetical protein
MFVHQLLLVGAVALLLAAGVRVASRLSPAPLERMVVAAVLAATVAAIEALALGLVSLGTNPTALFAGAVAAWLASAQLTVPPEISLWRQLLARWSRSSPLAWIAAGAVAGAGLAWTAWLLRYPAFDWDNLVYHIPEVVAWVHNGRPGSIVQIVPGFPYGNLPVTNELLLAWGSGISRSFVWIATWPAVMLTLLAASGWLGLRALGVARPIAALATASICAAPMLTSFQGNGANSDLPALTWLIVAGSLCAAAKRREQAGLLEPALLAGALAVGTKTTVAPLAAIVIALTAYHLRGSLRALRGPLAVAAAAALVVGGSWYVRDLIEHGSPLWPYYATPWGDALPHLQQPDITFFHRPLASLRRFGEAGYVTDTFLGGVLVLVAAVIAPLLARRRAVTLGALATGLTVFLWTLAPDTGAPYPSFPAADAFHGSVRFLMPSVTAATLTLALATGASGRRGARLFTGLLALALGLNVVQLFDLGFPRVPSPTAPLAGALIGGLLVLLVPRRGLRLVPSGVIAALALLGFSAALSAGAHGFVQRRARLGYADAELIRWFAAVGNDARPIYTAPVEIVMLAQSDLRRVVVALPRRERCQTIASRVRGGWVVVERLPTAALLGPSTTEACVARWRPVFEDTSNVIYDARSLGAGLAASQRTRTSRPVTNATHAAIIGTV